MSSDLPARLPGRYFDGRTSQLSKVLFSVDGPDAVLEGDIERRCPLGELRVSEPMRHVARRVTFPDGAYLEFDDSRQLNGLLLSTGHRDNWVARLAQSWRGALGAGAAAILVVALGYRFGLPVLASAVAHALPEKIERSIGSQTLDMLDARLLKPSRLPAARQSSIRERFAYLRPPRADAPEHQVLFRSSRLGPNAFALPSGQIIMTDEMVTLLGEDDDAIMGVLAHELGHLHERHGMRQIIQTTLVGATVSVLTGDVSLIVTSLSTAALAMRYSREAELEADDYAVAMLRHNQIGIASLARGFEKMAPPDKDDAGDSLPYLSSHPPTEERIRRIRQAEGR